MADSYQQDLLASLLPQWQQLLQGWSADGSLVAAAQEALLLDGEPQALTDLETQWSSGDFRGIPPIVLLSSSDISGAMGAYAISTRTIYLNQDWLLTATQDQVNAVLTEELGHHLDGLLNAVDTPGDEGEIFSSLLGRMAPATINSTDDWQNILGNGDFIRAEASSNTGVTKTPWGNALSAICNSIFSAVPPDQIKNFNIKLLTDASGNIYIGADASQVDPNRPWDYGLPLGGWIAQLSPDGSLNWASRLPTGFGLGQGSKNIAKSNLETGAIFVSATNYSDRTAVFKFDAQGNIAASVDITTRGGGWERPQQIITDQQDNIFLSSDVDGPELDGIVTTFNKDLAITSTIPQVYADAGLESLPDGRALAIGNGPWGYVFTVSEITPDGSSSVVYSQTRDNGVGGYFASAYDESSGRLAIAGIATDGQASGFIEVLDSNYNLLWRHEHYGRIDYTDLAFEGNGNIIAVGQYGSVSILSPDGQVLADTANLYGTVSLSQDAYVDPNCAPSNIEIAPDGSLIFTRYYQDNSKGPEVVSVTNAVDAFRSFESTNNSQPSSLLLTSDSVAENSAAGTLIGTLSATDLDSGTVFTYAVASGTGDTDNNLVEIIDDKVYVKSGAVIDFESNPTLDLRIQVSDNGTPALSYTKSFSVDVLNVQEDGSIGAITSSTTGIFKEGVTLTAGALTDPDGITGAVTYKWYKGATEVQSGASTTYEVGPLGEGTYRVDAVYVDGTGSTVTTSSATQVVDKVDNGQGSLSAITSSVPGTFQEGVRLTAGTITGDQDGYGSITGYQWFFNDVAITTNGTSSFYDVSNTGYGNYKVAVTYKDGQDYITTLTTANQVVNKFDNGNAAVSISGTATVGTTLTAAITTPDPDGDGTFTYQWQSSSNGSTWSNITGATASTYQLTSNELNKQVCAVVTSTDAQEYGPIAIYSNTTVPVVTPPDNILPTITDISVQGSNVILTFSEKVQATGLNNSTFVVKVGGAGRTVSATNYDSTNQNKVTLTLSGSAPASSTSLQVTYSATGSNIVKDLAGNSLGTFTNRSADSFLSGASVTSLYADYSNLTLTGTSAINGTGNAKNNTIIGNQANNTINGAVGADVLTGAGGTDTFVFTTLTNSLLGSPTNYTFDRITDFTIGQDRIDGPKTASTSQVQELGTVATLDQAGLQAILTTTRFTANGAATFTYNDNGTLRTFVALNNNVAGFDVTKDAVVEITGYSGLLTNLAIV